MMTTNIDCTAGILSSCSRNLIFCDSVPLLTFTVQPVKGCGKIFFIITKTAIFRNVIVKTGMEDVAFRPR